MDRPTTQLPTWDEHPGLDLYCQYEDVSRAHVLACGPDWDQLKEHIAETMYMAHTMEKESPTEAQAWREANQNLRGWRDITGRTLRERAVRWALRQEEAE